MAAAFQGDSFDSGAFEAPAGASSFQADAFDSGGFESGGAGSYSVMVNDLPVITGQLNAEVPNYVFGLLPVMTGTSDSPNISGSMDVTLPVMTGANATMFEVARLLAPVRTETGGQMAPSPSFSAKYGAAVATEDGNAIVSISQRTNVGQTVTECELGYHTINSNRTVTSAYNMLDLTELGGTAGPFNYPVAIGNLSGNRFLTLTYGGGNHLLTTMDVASNAAVTKLDAVNFGLSNFPSETYLLKLSATSFLLFYKDGTTGSNFCRVVTVDAGGFITLGAQQSLGAYDFSIYITPTLLNDGRVAVVMNDTSHDLKLGLLTISGTTVSRVDSNAIADPFSGSGQGSQTLVYHAGQLYVVKATAAVAGGRIVVARITLVGDVITLEHSLLGSGMYFAMWGGRMQVFDAGPHVIMIGSGDSNSVVIKLVQFGGNGAQFIGSSKTADDFTWALEAGVVGHAYSPTTRYLASFVIENEGGTVVESVAVTIADSNDMAVTLPVMTMTSLATDMNSISVTMPMMSIDTVAFLGQGGGISANLPLLTEVMLGGIYGLSATLPAVTGSIDATPGVLAVIEAVLPLLEADTEGLVGINANPAMTLPRMSMLMTSLSGVTGSVTTSLPKMRGVTTGLIGTGGTLAGVLTMIELNSFGGPGVSGGVRGKLKVLEGVCRSF